MGLDNFKAEVEKRLGYKFQPAKPYAFDRNVDDFGWIRGDDGLHHFSCFIENGRVQDEPGRDFKTALRDFLIQLKEFAGDNQELYLEEKEAAARQKAEEERQQAMRIPGMLKPSQIEDKDEDI